MDERFANLKKIPKDPARRLLALANAKLVTPLESPAAAPVGTVLAELAGKGAHGDMLRLLAAALPARECIWWGCLAAGDLVADDAPMPRPLAAARAWVFKPTEESRAAAQAALETADADDETTLCANAVVMCDGKLGLGDLSALDAPAGALGTFIFGQNVKSLASSTAETVEARATLLVDRALDIARGGSGRLNTAGASEGIAP
ncbi:DUF6931 family protein [Oceaniglobus trochenteri]|uniref:DUF6931 family protein n=1 Tax=Oceaniglobus trochenteri TaxID=2763260 RepID=UPI001CFF580B|nr:hypothetical protein [Oceaniglobus trochenteri]